MTLFVDVDDTLILYDLPPPNPYGYFQGLYGFLEDRPFANVIGVCRPAFLHVLFEAGPSAALHQSPEGTTLGVQAVTFNLFFAADPAI